MKISVSSLLEKLIWLLTVFLFTTFLLFETKTWGKYAFFGATVLIVLMSAVIYGGILRIRLQPYHLFIGIFTLFVGVSSVWAMQPSDSFSKMYSVLQIFGCSALLYIHYDRKDNIRSLLSAIKWAGYFVTIYSIAFYGLDALLESAQDLRLTTEFSNVNAIAMAAAISCMLQWGDILKKRNLLSSVMMIPAIILIAATQSRKAFLSLLLGIAGMYLLHSATQKGTAKKILKLLFYMLLLYLGLLLLL